MQINSAGYIRCGSNKCIQIGPLINWRFDCNFNHGFKKITNLNRLTEVLAVMSQATKDQKFIARLMGSVSEMFLKNQNDYVKIVGPNNKKYYLKFSIDVRYSNEFISIAFIVYEEYNNF